MKLSLKVVPGSSRNEISGWLGGNLKIRVTAPAESGKANVAVTRLLSETLGIPENSIQIISGKGKSRKIIKISGLPDSDVKRKLNYNN